MDRAQFWRGAEQVYDTPTRSARFSVDVPSEMLEAMTAGDTIAARIQRNHALQVPAVLRARNLIAGTLGSLPLVTIGPDKREVEGTYLLGGNVDPDIPNSVVFAQTFEDLLFEGVAWWRVGRTGWHGYPVEASHVPTSSVHVAGTGWTPAEGYVGPDQTIPVNGQVFIDGYPVNDDEIIRFDSPNPPLLTHAARAIRACLALDKAAALHSAGAPPVGVFTPVEGVDPGDDDTIQEYLDKFHESRSRNAYAYINAALKLQTLGFNPEQLQLAEQRQHAVLEIARAAGVDPEDLGVSTTSRTYQNAETRRRDLLDFTLGAYVSAVQDRLSMRDVLPRGYQAKLKLDGFLRSDTKTRAETYWLGLQTGMYTKDEVRELEDRPPLPAAAAVAPTAPGGGGTAPSAGSAVPQPVMGADVAGAQFADDPKKPYGDVPYADPGYQADKKKRYPIDTEAHCRAAWSYINQEDNAAKYSADELAKVKAKIRAALRKYGVDVEEASSAEVEFDLPQVEAAFRVNPESRTISGLAVPWNEVAWSGGNKYRFAQDSLQWADSRRVKLLLSHDITKPIGRAVRLDSTAQGLEVTFKVARGDEGTRALELAEDGVLDGLSVGVDFVDGNRPGPDPSDPSVRFVRAAHLREITLTAMPSFDNARVTDVAAQRGAGKDHTMAEKTAAPDVGSDGVPGAEFDFTGYMKGLADATAESHKKLTAELTDSISDTLSAGVKAALENISSPQDGPGKVKAARFVVTREAPVYSFTGGGHSLVRDAYYGATQGDADALERLRKYRVQTEEIAKLAAVQATRFTANRLGAAEFATATTVTDPEIIPPGYRPDLYIPQLAKERPLVSACSRGTISNASPFTVPVFTSITGGTADHTQGTNPTDGTLAFESKTVAPGAISGLLKLSREIVDSSNPAIDAIALQAMRESYAQQTEAKVYTLLNGANGAGGVITGDNVPSGAQASTVVAALTQPGGQALALHIRERLAKYPFARFGTPSLALMGQNATVRLATAVDTTGRPLFPSLGFSNTMGSGNAYTQGWNVDGLGFVPAWAMTGTAAGDSQILILNSSDAWVWESPLLSFRYEERSGPALIELALFGYFGTHLLRPVGLSGIRITTV